MRGRAQTGKIIEVRARSKLWSVFAMEGKAQVFFLGLTLNQTLKQLSWGCEDPRTAGFIDRETKPTVVCLDLFGPRYPCGCSLKRRRRLAGIIVDLLFCTLKDGVAESDANNCCMNPLNCQPFLSLFIKFCTSATFTRERYRREQ